MIVFIWQKGRGSHIFKLYGAHSFLMHNNNPWKTRENRCLQTSLGFVVCLGFVFVVWFCFFFFFGNPLLLLHYHYFSLKFNLFFFWVQRYSNRSGRIHLCFLPAEMSKCIAPKYQQKCTKPNTLIYYSCLFHLWPISFFETGRIITSYNRLKLTFLTSFLN